MATSEFGKAFREARAAGDKTFTFNGKKYTTDLAPAEQKSIGSKSKMGEYVPRDSDTRKGEIMTSKNAVGRDNYVRSGQKSFDTEREPEALAEPNKPGTNVRYENTDTSDMTYKRGGSVKPSKMGSVRTSKPSMSSASSRADGIASRGKTRGRMV
jgi:hypothetical protein